MGHKRISNTGLQNCEKGNIQNKKIVYGITFTRAEVINSATCFGYSVFARLVSVIFHVLIRMIQDFLFSIFSQQPNRFPWRTASSFTK